jgi:hypothetical protein
MGNSVKKSFVLVALALAVLCVAPLRAQDAASITGIVADASGAVVPGAKIVLSNKSTNLSYQAVSNATGSYTISNIVPGPGYTETVSRDGFQTTVLTGLYLNVATTRSQNVKLVVGGVSETVSVSASNQQVTLDTTDATIGNSFEVQDLNELPIANRDSPSALFTQQPGMTLDGAATGARVDQDRVTLDGLDVNDMATGNFGTIVGNAPVDSVQEFRGTTGGMLSSSGNGGGGQFELVTRSGTNKFHGAVVEYHRDTDLEANDWFNNINGVGRPPLIRNQFGANLGGPIWKNKLFFFFDYNGRRDTLSNEVDRTVPLTSFENGTLTYFTNEQAGTTSSINAAQVAAFDPKGIGYDAAMIQFISGRYPAANDLSGDKGDLLNTAGFRFNAPFPYVENDYVGKVDFDLTRNNHFWGRTTFARTTGTEQAIQFPGDPPTWPYLDKSYAWVGGWDWTIGSNKTNSLSYGETVANYGFPNTYNPQGDNQYGWMGNPSGGTYLDSAYASASNAQSRIYPIPVLRDDFHWDRGRHLWSVGGTFKYISPQGQTILDYNSPLIGLGGGMEALTSQFRPTDLDGSGSSLAFYDSAYAFALGHFGAVGATFNYNSSAAALPQGTGSHSDYRYYETEIYMGDTWKVTPALTITYGLRYQNYTVPYEVNGLESVQDLGFDDYFATRVKQSTDGVGGPASLPGGGGDAVPFITYGLGGKANAGAPPYYNPNNLNFAPRLSFAWAPTADRKTIFNGGGGVVYDQQVINAIQYQQTQYSYLFQSSATNNLIAPATAANSSQYNTLATDTRFTSLAAAPPPPAPPVQTRPTYEPFVTGTGANANPYGLANGGAFNETIDRNLKTPYSIQFNAGMQHEFPAGFLLKVNYAGRLGRRLMGQADAEQLVDFTDKVSGQTMGQAMGNLTTWLRNNPSANPANAPIQPWFENVLYSANTLYGVGMSNTDFIAADLAPYPVRGDFADTMWLLSAYGLQPDNVGMASQFSENTFYTNKGFSAYNGMLVTLHKNPGHGLQFDLNYTWSHSIDNVSVTANTPAYGGYGFICDVQRPRLCRGNSDFDVTNYLSGNFLYQLPFGRGRTFGANAPWWANEAIGGWELSGLPSWHTGNAYFVAANAFVAGYSNDAPAILTGNKSLLKTQVNKVGTTLYANANPQAAYNQYIGPVGFNIGARNNLRGPGFVRMDLGLGKTFPIYKEGVVLKFRADAFNATNHPSFATPSSDGDSITNTVQQFGVLSSMAAPIDANGYRVLQLALRLEF